MHVFNHTRKWRVNGEFRQIKFASLKLRIGGGTALQPALDFVGPTGVTQASVVAASPGEPAVIQSMVIPLSGMYTVIVSSAGASTGSYTAEITLNGQRVELFEALSPSPLSPSFLATALNDQSRYIELSAPASYDPTLHEGLAPDDYALTGGTDGLKDQRAEDWQAALSAQTVAPVFPGSSNSPNT